MSEVASRPYDQVSGREPLSIIAVLVLDELTHFLLEEGVRSCTCCKFAAGLAMAGGVASLAVTLLE